jgi:DNA-binding transcriptional ArsR family regulator
VPVPRTVEQFDSVVERAVTALKHPLRLELLRFFVEDTFSPNEIAKKLRQPLGKVSYHTRVLEETGFVELVDTRQVRGAVEHRYVSVRRGELSQAEWEALSDEEQADITCLVCQHMTAEMLAALASGKLDSRPERHLTWHPLSLDEQGWGELMALLLGTMREAEEIQARSDERRTASEEKPIATVLGLMGFERAPGDK